MSEWSGENALQQAMETLKEDGMQPDWTKESDYPAELSLKGWAWEFLRRNEQYRNRWMEYVALKKNILNEFGPEETWGMDVVTGTEAWYFDPPAQPGETQAQWRDRVGNAGDTRGPLPLTQGMAREWGLVEMFNPSFSWVHLADIELGPRFVEHGPPIHYYVGDFQGDDYLAPPMFPTLPSRFNVAVVQIDMTRSLPAQLEDIEQRLAARQDELVAKGVLGTPSKKGAKTGHYRDLLRIYDAYEAKKQQGSNEKLTNDEIANVLYAHSQKGGTAQSISERYATAKGYVDKGYMSLLA